MIVNIHEAKTQLSRLLERVRGGERIVIAKSGTPVAMLIPFRESEGERRPGAWKGRVRIAKDFDELPGDIAASFRGEE